MAIVVLLCGRASAQPADIRWLRSLHRPGGSATMEAFSYTSYGVALAAPAAQLLYGYAWNDSTHKRLGLQTLASLVVTTGITYAIKYAADRPRPYETYADIIPYRKESGHSLPSGHTSIAFSTAATLSLQYKKWYVAVPACLYAGGIGYSRLYSGDHYPSDVLLGAAVGAGSAWLCHLGNKWLHKRKRKLR
ncbi:MAG: phosphatase PAP2 family protein [Flavipsychrobacter sp.]|nr:phosphatase PAP2 family protein [Flavipsychrobacter sp.]